MIKIILTTAGLVYIAACTGVCTYFGIRWLITGRWFDAEKSTDTRTEEIQADDDYASNCILRQRIGWRDKRHGDVNIWRADEKPERNHDCAEPGIKIRARESFKKSFQRHAAPK